MSRLHGSYKYMYDNAKANEPKIMSLQETIKYLQKQYYDNYMSGMNDPRIQGLDIVSKIYAVSIDYLTKQVYKKK